FEQAQIDLKEGKYQIFIQERSEGSLVAEVRDQERMLLGHVEVSLSEIEYSDSQNLKKVLNLKLKPVATSIEGQVKSYYSAHRGESDADVTVQGFVDNIKTDKKGRFSRSRILHNSQVLVSAQKAGYWGTIALTDNSKDIE